MNKIFILEKAFQNDISKWQMAAILSKSLWVAIFVQGPVSYI